MTQNELINELKSLKKQFQSDGFVIDGIFGSYARGDFKESSDIDILYHLEEPFMKKYSGFMGFSRLNEIKQILSNKIQKRVDIASKDGLSKTGKKYILNEVVYV